MGNVTHSFQLQNPTLATRKCNTEMYSRISVLKRFERGSEWYSKRFVIRDELACDIEIWKCSWAWGYWETLAEPCERISRRLYAMESQLWFVQKFGEWTLGPNTFQLRSICSVEKHTKRNLEICLHAKCDRQFEIREFGKREVLFIILVHDGCQYYGILRYSAR